MIYGQLAEVYDDLMEDIDYKKWADYLIQLLACHKAPGSTVLDLGCGTGTISHLLAQKGFNLICIDISSEMLALAEQKFREDNLKVTLYRQDIRNLYLENSVDVAISTFDTFNYLLQLDDLQITFQKVHQVLNQQGLFIFDLNTVHKLSSILGNNIFTYNTEKIVYIWDNEYNQESRLCKMYLTFFKLDERTGQYYRFDEVHTQRAYVLEEIKQLLQKSGFKLLGFYDQLSFKPPKPDSQKMFFVARKV